MQYSTWRTLSTTVFCHHLANLHSFGLPIRINDWWLICSWKACSSCHAFWMKSVVQVEKLQDTGTLKLLVRHQSSIPWKRAIRDEGSARPLEMIIKAHAWKPMSNSQPLRGVDVVKTEWRTSLKQVLKNRSVKYMRCNVEHLCDSHWAVASDSSNVANDV